MKKRRLEAIQRAIQELNTTPKRKGATGLEHLTDEELDTLLYSDPISAGHTKELSGYPAMLAAFQQPTFHQRKTAFEDLIYREANQVWEFITGDTGN